MCRQPAGQHLLQAGFVQHAAYVGAQGDPHLRKVLGGAVIRRFVRAQSPNFRQWAVDRPDDVSHTDPARLPGEAVAAVRTADAAHQAGAPQLGEDRLDELAGQVLAGDEHLGFTRSGSRAANSNNARTAYSLFAEMSTATSSHHRCILDRRKRALSGVREPRRASRVRGSRVGLSTGQLSTGGAARDLQLHAGLEADSGEPVDLGTHRAVPGLVQQFQVVRTHEATGEVGDRSEEAHDEVVGRMIVELGRRADLLDSGRG